MSDADESQPQRCFFCQGAWDSETGAAYRVRATGRHVHACEFCVIELSDWNPHREERERRAKERRAA